MKKSIATITARAILGFLALGLFAGCAAVLNGPPAELTESGPAETGQVVIRMGPKAEVARTLMPAAADYEALSYTYTFTSESKEPVSGALTGGTATADLAAGTWTLTVEGKGGEDALSLKGTVTDIEVSAGTVTDVSVNMKGYTEAGAGNGTLSYTVTFPAAVSVGTLTVYRWDNDERQGTPANLAAGIDTDNDPDTKTVSGTIDLSAGYYRVALDLYKADGILNQTDIAHIYPDLDTEAPYTIAAGDFTPATVDSARTSLAGVLGSVSGLAGGANVTYVLPIGNETMSAASVSNTGPVTVTIDGGGREVTLDASGGSLITVGDKVTLVLKNITLKGRGEDYDNTAALVSVESGGTLVMKDGSKISGNRNHSASYSYGGGVYVGSGGTFTMNGGEIAENTASSSEASYSYGGGVYVGSGGTFTMSGGEITGNTSSASYWTYGGGVSVEGGTFTMSGGEIVGNTTFSTHSYGGGVYVGSGGIFTMSGGDIAGNAAAPSSSYSYSYGGGVSVEGGTFTMSGGEIVGNTVYAPHPYSCGGGVYVGNGGTFTMGGGEITGNTAAATAAAFGGGVCVYYGTFTKSGGGTIYGSNAEAALKNTAVSGHAVYVLSPPGKELNTTAGPDVDLDSGWEDISTPPAPSTVTGIIYDDAWALQADGRRKSPAIGDNSVTKARVSFTATDNAFITIQLDVSSQLHYDWAFISTLDNGSATYSSGYYTGSRISGTQSVTVMIPVPTAGDHFVYIGYQKDGSSSNGSDCAWFKVVE